MKKISVRELETILKNTVKDPEERNAVSTQADEKGKHPLDTDPMVYRIVVMGLVGIILTCLVCTYCLTLDEVTNMPEIFMAIGSAAVGAIAGLLAPRPGSVEED